MDIKRLISTFTYRIEAKPQGGFIAYGADPGVPPLEAPTQVELQQKIQANISAALAREYPGLNLPSRNLPKGKEFKVNFHIEVKPGGGFSPHYHDPATAVEESGHEGLEHPFAEKLAGVVGEYFLSEVLAKQGGAGEIKTFADRKTGFTADAASQKLGPGSMETFQPSGTLQPSNIDDSPLTFEESKSWPIFQFLFTFLVVAALLYFFLHR